MYQTLAIIVMVLIILSPLGLIFLFWKERQKRKKQSIETQNKAVLSLIAVIIGLAVRYFTFSWMLGGISAAIAEIILLMLLAKQSRERSINKA